MFRDADHEVGFYEDRRWTERPEADLERALERALFDGGAVARSLQTSAPTLTANLIAFEEVRQPRSGAPLTVAYALHDDRTVLRGGTLTVERPLLDGDVASQPRRVASAMGEALRAAVDQVVAEVLVALAEVSPLDGR